MYKATPGAPSGREMHSWLRRNRFIILEVRIVLDRRPTGGGGGGGVDVVHAEGGERVDEGWGVGGGVECGYSIRGVSCDVVCWRGVEVCHFEVLGRGYEGWGVSWW